MDVLRAAAAASGAARQLAVLPAGVRTDALALIAEHVRKNAERVFEANRSDLRRAEGDSLAAPLLKRLRFDDAKLAEVCSGLEVLASAVDPLGEVLEARELDAGLILRRVSVPLGVIGMIFESRPDALVQIAGLAVRSGNALLLKGGSEAAESNTVLVDIIDEATREAGLPAGWVSLLHSRDDVRVLLSADNHVDLLIPRGSNAFVRYIMDNTRIPVLGHADGVCHVYVDESADPEMAAAIVLDAKTQYPAVCNAVETLLVHEAAASRVLPAIERALRQHEPPVELRAEERAAGFLSESVAATEEDWSAEYLDYVLAVRVVDTLDAAIEHVNTYGSGHTDSIVTESPRAAETFMAGVDSGNVFWNASTRFSDGFRYGLGAEVGISTSKIHARGPVGIAGLMTYQWRLAGKGHVVADYAGGQGRRFSHRTLSPDEAGRQ